MTPNEKGRHCDSCNKTVIDFTQFTDGQLVDFFSKLTGSVCGRLTSFQLEREIVYNEPLRHPFLYKLLFGTAMTLSLTGSANGNYNPNSTPLIQKSAQPQKTHRQNGKKPAHSNPHHYIEGYVRDEKTQEGLTSVRLAFLCMGRIIAETKTDTNGHYKVHINAMYLGKEITVTRTYVYQNYSGYTDNITIDRLPYHYDISLSRNEMVVVAKDKVQFVLQGCTYPGGIITKQDIRQVVKNANFTEGDKGASMDVDHPDNTTIHRHDSPYW